MSVPRANFTHTGERDGFVEKSVYVKKCEFFFSRKEEHGIRKPWRLQGAQRETPLPRLVEPSREVRRVAIGRGRIKLRLPRGKTRQIAWMSTIPGNHDQVVSRRPAFPAELICERIPFFILTRSFSHLNPRFGNQVSNLDFILEITTNSTLHVKLLHLKYYWQTQFISSNY